MSGANIPQSVGDGGKENVTGNNNMKATKNEEERKSRLLHILPKLPSSDSLNNSPGPSSPGKIQC